MDTKWTALVIASVFSGAALAAGSGSSDFQSMDKNGDGYLSQDEAASNPDLQSKWNDADLNDDGQLDQSEFSQFETMGGSGSGTESTPGSSGTMDSPGSSGGDMGTGSGSGTGGTSQ